MEQKQNLAIIGAGGHSAVIADWAAASRQFDKISRFDDSLSEGFKHADGVSLARQNWQFVIGIGDNAVRIRVAEELAQQDATFAIVVHPGAIISEGATIAPGSVVAPGVVVNVSAQIGKHCILNTGATIDHHCSLADGVHVGPGANLAGGVHAGLGAFFGVGACVVPNVAIGAGATVGAGSVVVSDVAAETIVKGSPAR